MTHWDKIAESNVIIWWYLGQIVKVEQYMLTILIGMNRCHAGATTLVILT